MIALLTALLSDSIETVLIPELLRFIKARIAATGVPPTDAEVVAHWRANLTNDAAAIKARMQVFIDSKAGMV
jgi:hypothetical protein